MDKQRWNNINEILDTVLELEEKGRTTYILENCGQDAALADEILSLLKREPESDEFWKSGARKNDTLLRDYSKQLDPETFPESFTPFKIGKYEVLETLGRGGMGTVYKAQRIDGEFERLVAIKVVNEFFNSSSVIERFRRERQILARLNHPNIAALYDGGFTDDGRPYLVMELIEGKPITDFCVAKKLSLSERIELIKTLCKAVHHAHQNLVVHRDLKPSNILVDDAGNLKVLDFGIAKLIEESPEADFQKTAASVRLMSLQYASPEQINDEAITTATDVYNLGLIAYELLLGKKVFDLSGLKRGEAEQVILNESPSLYHQNLPRKIGGDLKAIVMKALRKEPQQRYASMLAFYDDICNYQKEKPVQAVGDEWKYKLKRFTSRHRKSVAASGLILGIVLTLLAYHINTVSAERDKALVEAEKSRLTSAFMAGIFRGADYTRDDEVQITSKRFLDDGVEYIHNELGHYPDVQARLLETVARIKHNLGHLDEAETLYLEILELRQQLPDHHDDKYLMAASYHNLGTVYRDKGDYPKAESNLLLALEHKENFTSPENDASYKGNTMNELGLLWYNMGKYVKSDSIVALTKNLYEENQLTNTIKYTNMLELQGWLNFEKGNFEASDSLFSATLSMRRALYSEGNPEASTKLIATALHNLGWALYHKGEWDEAVRVTEEAIVIRDSTFGRNHSETAWTLNNLGVIEQSRNNIDKAEALISEAYSIRKQQLGETHPQTLFSLTSLTIIQYRRGNFDKAVTGFQEVLNLNRKIYEAPHSVLVNNLGNLGGVLQEANRPREAYQIFTEAYEMGTQIYPDDHVLLKAIESRIEGLEAEINVAKE